MSEFLTDKEQAFLVALFKSFEEAEIIAIVLRNYEKFPVHIGNDLEIFIPRYQHNKARAILLEVLSIHCGSIMNVYQKDSFAALWMSIDNNDPIHLDFYHGAYFWRGRQYLSDKELIANTRDLKEQKIIVPAREHEAIILYVTSLIWGGF